MMELGLKGQSEPVPVPGLPADIVQIGAGYELSCARTHGGEVYCWGTYTGQSSFAPAHVESLPSIFDLVVGEHHACGRDARNQLWCWGDNQSGQAAPPTLTMDNEGIVPPSVVEGIEGELVEVSGGDLSTFARTSDGKIWGWGGHGVGGPPEVVGETTKE
jgi:alpha-tubulin suppressor-like RCC1 family protein